MAEEINKPKDMHQKPNSIVAPIIGAVLIFGGVAWIVHDAMNAKPAPESGGHGHGMPKKKR